MDHYFVFVAIDSSGRGLFSENNVMDALEHNVHTIYCVTHLKISSVRRRIIPMILQNVGLSKEKNMVVWIPR